jgi:hypothetical protein
MRYLALLLLAPWLVVLGWAYFAYPKSLPRTIGRRVFDGFAVAATVISVVLGYEAVAVPQVGQFGRSSGAIWQQVLPALYGYGACVAVLLVALVVRSRLWGRRQR